MSPRSKKEYLEAIYVRYKRASRKEKANILDEFCAACGYHRKHPIRLLRTFRRYRKPKHKRKGKPPVYHKESILKPLKRIWHSCKPLLLQKTQSDPSSLAAQLSKAVWHSVGIRKAGVPQYFLFHYRPAFQAYQGTIYGSWQIYYKTRNSST